MQQKQDKYQEALDNFILLVGWIELDQTIEELQKDVEECRRSINVLQELVSNEPLKLEEIKEGMWVYDKSRDLMIRIADVGAYCLLPNEEYEAIYQYESEEFYGDGLYVGYIPFEEGRFFRRVVLC